jgi:hypothetical protein
MELQHNGNAGKSMYASPALSWERIPTAIPYVWVEHLKLSDRTVLIVNDELGGFDMDTQSDSARYSLIEKTFPAAQKMGSRIQGSIEIEDDETVDRLKEFTL